MSGAAQTSYTKNIGNAYPGMPYDLTLLDVLGRFAEGSKIPFGRAVIQGTTGDTCRLPDEGDQLGNGATPGSAIFLGVTTREQTYEQYPDGPLASPIGNGEISYYRDDPVINKVGIARQGRIYVLVDAPVNVDDPAFFRVNNGTATEPLGSFRGAASADHRAIASARFVTAAPAGGVAAIQMVIAI